MTDSSPIKVRCQQRALSRALAIVGAMVPKRTPNPGWRGVLIRREDDHLTLTTTDCGETFVSVQIPGSGSGADQLLVDCDELTRAVAAAVKGRGRAEANELPVEIDGVELAVGARRVQLRAYASDEFPTPPDPLPVLASVERSDFVRAASQVTVAACRDDVQHHLYGVRVQLSRRTVTLVATDRYRLTFVRLSTTNVEPLPSPVLRFVVPPTTFDGTLGHFSEREVLLGWRNIAGASWFSLACGDITLLTRTDADRFPPYKRHLPPSTPATATISREAFLALARRAAGLAAALPQRVPGITMVLSENEASIVPVPPTPSEVVAGPTVPATTRGIPGEVRIAFAPRFLIEAVESFASEHVSLHLTDPSEPAAPAIITESPDGLASPSAFRHAVVPLRVEYDDDAPAPERPRGNFMRFSSPLPALAEAVALAGAGVVPQSMLETRRVVRITATDGGVTVSGGNAAGLVSVALPATPQVGGKSVSLHADHAELTDVLAAISAGRGKRQLQELDATISRADIGAPTLDLAGYRVPLTAHDDTYQSQIPAPPPFIEVDGSAFARDVKRALKTVDRGKNALPALANVNVIVEQDALVLWSTDRFQGCVARLPITRLGPAAETTAVLIDSALLSAIAKHVGDGPVGIGWSHTDLGTFVSITFGAVAVRVRGSGESGRRLESVLPRESNGTATAERKRLLAEVRAASALIDAQRIKAADRWLLVKAIPAGVAVAPYFEAEGDDPVTSVTEADVRDVDGAWRTLLRPQHLAKALSTFEGDQVTLHIPFGSRGVVITEAGATLADEWAFRFALMPKPLPQPEEPEKSQ